LEKHIIRWIIILAEAPPIHTSRQQIKFKTNPRRQRGFVYKKTLDI